MALDPNIALQYRGVEAPNQLAQYGAIAAIQNAQNQNALAQYQLGAAQRAEAKDIARTNALAQAGTDDAAIANALLKSGDLPGYVSFVKTSREANKAQVDLVDSKLKQSRSFLDGINPNDPNAPQQYLAWHQANHADPVLGPVLKARGITPEQSMTRIQEAIAQGPSALAQLINQSKLGAEKFIELNKPTTQVVDQSGQKQVIQIPGLGGAPTTVGTFADVPLPKTVEEQKTRIAQASRPITTITNVQEKAEAGAYGKMLVDQYGDISKAAGLAIKTLPAIEANLGALNKGLDTGFGTDAKKAGARILGALGVQDAEKFAANAEMFQSNAIQAVLQKQLEQKGPQTESDARRIEQVGAELGKTKAANEFILSMAKEQLRRDVEQRNFYDKWKKQTGSFEGAEDAWFSGEGGKSLFDRPALKKYAPGAAVGQSAVQQIPGQRPAAAPAAAAIPQAAIDALKAGRGTDAQFDAIFGPGAAKRARGQ